MDIWSQDGAWFQGALNTPVAESSAGGGDTVALIAGGKLGSGAPWGSALLLELTDAAAQALANETAPASPCGVPVFSLPPPPPPPVVSSTGALAESQEEGESSPFDWLIYAIIGAPGEKKKYRIQPPPPPPKSGSPSKQKGEKGEGSLRNAASLTFGPRGAPARLQCTRKRFPRKFKKKIKKPIHLQV